MNNILLFIITGIICFGLIRGIDVYATFVEGAKEGLKTTAKIFPYMLSLMVCITIFQTSGAVGVLQFFMSPILKVFGIPSEVLPLIILKPFSGGASVGVLSDIFTMYGVDSYIGYIASAIMGSSETIFYTLTLYFGFVGIKNTRHTLTCALIAQFCGIVGAIIAVNLLF